MNGRKPNRLIIQQLATNPATNGMEFVLDLHDFVCCMDETLGNDSVEMEIMVPRPTWKNFDEFVVRYVYMPVCSKVWRQHEFGIRQD